MTKILYWNVNKFSLNKIQGGSRPQQSASRSDYILQNIFAANMPDIFVIVEVTAPNADVAWEGILSHGGGGIGAGELLTRIRNLPIPGVDMRSWCLVPPLCTGFKGCREMIAVYYNSARLQFVGPYIWAEIPEHVVANPILLYQSRPPVPEEAMVPTYYPSTYDEPWNLCLPDRRIPDRPDLPFVVPNTGLNENEVAGKWWWKEIGGADFPDEYVEYNGMNFPNPDNRKPLLTQFLDLEENRMIRVYSLHTSPASAVRAVKKLTYLEGIDSTVAMTDAQRNANNYTVDVIVGDFNVDTFNAFVQLPDNNAYYNLIHRNHFIMQFPPYQNNNYQVDLTLQPVRLTHFLPLRRATPFNATGTTTNDPTANVYPRFGYMGSTGGRGFQQTTNTAAIDNILTRYGEQCVPPAQYNPTIVNTVVGSPYGAVPVNFTYPVQMANPVPCPPPQPGGYSRTAANAPLMSDNFQNIWNNFKRTYSTSDHMALVIDV